MKKIRRIVLIAGNGNFPILLAKAAKANGIDLVAIAINSETDKAIEKVVSKVYWLNIGEAGKLLEVLKKEAIDYAVMAGKVTKQTLFRQGLGLDKEARRLLANVIDRRDDTLLTAVANRLKQAGVELIDSTVFIKDMMIKKGVLTRKRPTRGEYKDIDFGYKVAKEMGRLDIGQSVVVKRMAVIAVEAIEGTDENIMRAGRLAGPGCVVVKLAKPKQDMRFDVPVVGIDTIESMKKAKASVIALESGKVIFLDKDKAVKEANDNNISIIAI